MFLVDGGLLRLLFVCHAGRGQQIDPRTQRQHVAVLFVRRPETRGEVSTDNRSSQPGDWRQTASISFRYR